MRPLLVTLTLVLLAAYWFGWLDWLSGGGQYSAEVGYYEGTVQRWYYGAPTTREACTAEAIGMYNHFNQQSPGRAFSWACMLTKDGRYISRHR